MSKAAGSTSVLWTGLIGEGNTVTGEGAGVGWGAAAGRRGRVSGGC